MIIIPLISSLCALMFFWSVFSSSEVFSIPFSSSYSYIEESTAWLLIIMREFWLWWACSYVMEPNFAVFIVWVL